MIGAVFQGRYNINGFLSEGPIFALYSAKDRLTAKDVSVRVLKQPFDQEEKFKLALAAAIERTLAVRSPFVERLIEIDTDEGQSYVLGELTRAPSLSDRIRKLAPFTPSVSVACGTSIARGLDAYHKAGIAHGDISGENIALLGDGEIRLQMGGVWEAYSASTTAGILVLPTLAPYLAPEVSNGDLPNACSDLYAVGILLFELLSGRRPYVADTGLATAMRHASEVTPRVKDLNPSIPSVLDEIVYKAMAKDPSARYRTANELIFDLRQTQDALRFGRTLSWPISSPAPAPQAQRKMPVAPKMSAVREPEARPQRERREKPDRDVPVWMLVFLAGTIGVFVALILVNFFIGASRPRLVTVPNLAGLTLAEAKTSLAPMHLKFKMGSPVPSNQYEADRIVTSDPPPGARLSENSTIQLELSLGASQISVPQLKSLTPDKARQTLSTVNLKLDDKMDRVNDHSVPNGAISKQTPPPGSKLARSSKVHVTVSDYSVATTVKSSKRYRYTLQVALTDIQDPVQVRIDMTDDEGTRTIFDEIKSPGDSFRVPARGTGDKATFVVFYNGTEVERKVQTASDGPPNSPSSSSTASAPDAPTISDSPSPNSGDPNAGDNDQPSNGTSTPQTDNGQ